MKQSFQLANPQAFLSDGSKNNLLRLMVAFDTMRALYRWIINTIESGDEIEREDSLTALVSGCGWTWETIKLMREFHASSALSRNMLASKPELFDIWDEVMGPPDTERLNRLNRIRNKCFGHFDESIVNDFRKRDFAAGELPPFLITYDEGKLLQTRYPWAYAIQSVFLWPTPMNLDVVKARVQDMRVLVFNVTHLAGHLITELLGQDTSIKWQKL